MDFVAIESRVKVLKELLQIESDDVLFIGICGMSGTGKTTLAEIVYKDLCHKFKGCCFIENIKDVCKKSERDLCKLIKKLLTDTLNEEKVHVGSVTEGVDFLQRRLGGLKILLVLDDVNHRDQLDSLAKKRDWFGQGSRIIMTTTNEDLLTAHGVDGIYRCKGLKFDDAFKLFCMSSFKETQPKHGYEMLSSDITYLADGLPLALNVFGSLLVGKGVEYWRDTLEKLKQYPEKEILERLEVCYDRLDRNEQEIFIYIACFLKGRNRSLIEDILVDIGLYPIRGIDILINRSLIAVSYDNNVWMHDLVQQMGWEIVRKKYPNKPGQRMALKSNQDIVHVLTSNVQGTETIEIINQDLPVVEIEKCNTNHDSLSKMTKLKFLRISNVLFQNGLEYLSNDLRILEWCGFSLNSLPSTFEPKQLYILDLQSSQIEKLWEKDIGMPNLRYICLSHSQNLTKIPDLTSTPRLQKLNLEGCRNLVEVHKSVFFHRRLSYVNLKDCISLEILGSDKLEMEALEALFLSGCSKLRTIPELGENMKCLQYLYLDGINIKRVPENLGKMHSLQKLDLSETSIQELPSSILHLNRLRLLRFQGCYRLPSEKSIISMNLCRALLGLKILDLSNCSLSVIPNHLGSLSSLIELDLSGNDFVVLPQVVSSLSNLRMFRLNRCKRLQSLPPLPRMMEISFCGPLVRVNYHISGEESKNSKVNATGQKVNLTISCLSCPKLVETERNCGLADTILMKYLQVRTNFQVKPIAIFELVGAGEEIPEWFDHQSVGNSVHVQLSPNCYSWCWICQFMEHIANKPRSKVNHVFSYYNKSIKREFLWAGLALCAHFVVYHPPAGLILFPQVKYEIVVHISVAEKTWKIPMPVNFLDVELEAQMVAYWTFPDDLKVDMIRQPENCFDILFAVEPEDGNLEVLKSAVRFVHMQDFPELIPKKFTHDGNVEEREPEASFVCLQHKFGRPCVPMQDFRHKELTHSVPKRVISDLKFLKELKAINSQLTHDLRSYETACKDDPELRSFDLQLKVLTSKVINTLAATVNVPSVSLDSLCAVTGSLLEINQIVVKVILDSRNDIWEDSESKHLAKNYFKSSVTTLEFSTAVKNRLKRTCGSPLFPETVVQQFEEEQTEGSQYCHIQKGSPGMELFRRFIAEHSIISNRLSVLFQSLYRKQVFELRNFHIPRMSSKAHKKLSTVIFGATFSVALICLGVVAAISAPSVIRRMAVEVALPSGWMGKWLNSTWRTYENEMKVQEMIDQINQSENGSCTMIKNSDSIQALVDKMESEINDMGKHLQYAVAIDGQEDSVDEIKKKLNGFAKTVEGWNEYVKRSCHNINSGMKEFWDALWLHEDAFGKKENRRVLSTLLPAGNSSWDKKRAADPMRFVQNRSFTSEDKHTTVSCSLAIGRGIWLDI